MMFVLVLAIGISINKVWGQQVCDYCKCCTNSVCPNHWNKHCSKGCLDGYWGNFCENKCPDKCKTCHNSSGNYCTACKPGYFGTGYKLCSQTCESRCNSCTSLTNCSSCKDGYYLSSTRSGLELIQDCSQACPKYCRTCTSDTQCFSCYNGYYNGEWNNQRVANCSLKCSPNCKACTSYNECTECRDGYFSPPKSGNDCLNQCYHLCKTCTDNGYCDECYNGNYGKYCQFNCSVGCRENACNKDTGYCDCASRSFWGERCENTCSKGCISLSCNKETGKCSNGCKLGYAGEWCDICKTGFNRIGDICTNCSETCEVCSAGNVCTKCKDNYGGTACRILCPATCRSCVSENACTECIDGYLGQTCSSSCPKGQWGNNCFSVCPSNCINGYCNHINGSCNLGCKEGYKGDLCDCPSNCEECDAAGSCTRCIEGFTNVDKMCVCRKDMCADNICTRCSDDSFYVQDGACCPCSSNCKGSVCVSAFNCSLGCKSGYYGNYCTKMCSDIDHWCEECKINYGHRHPVCHHCKSGYYPFKNAAYGYYRCKECPDTCVDGECDSKNGECIKGCAVEKWGLTCQKDCPIHCLKCDRINANCSVCEGGKYLADCSQSCSASCQTIEGQLLCRIENGACLNGCANMNKYGTHCEKNCSNYCKENVCSWLTGDCVKGCQNNHWGKQCEHVCNDNCKPIEGENDCNETTGHCLAGCIDGHYSAQCEMNCSINCLNTSCDTRGRCIYGCSGDFVDASCLQAKFKPMQESDGSAGKIGGIVGGVVALLIIFGVVIVVVLFKRRHRKDEANMKNESHQSTNAVRFSEVAERGRQTEHNDSVPVYATPDKPKSKKDTAKAHTVNKPSYQKSHIAKTQSGSEKGVTVYENAVQREDVREDLKPETGNSQSLEDSAGAVGTRQSLGRYLQELEDPSENVGSSSAALVLGSGSHVKKSDEGDTYYNTAEVFKRKILLEKLAEFVDKKTTECFEEEFKLLPEGLSKKYTESQKKENITKNRYRGIYPYDDTRVVLRDGGSDYINASYIDGFKQLKAYIASLGPTYKYMEDMSAFWRMVWQEKCGKIIMLTNLMEAGTRKCDQYWPMKGSSQLYADINVTCLSEEIYADYTVRVFNIQKKSAKRTVTQVHFTAWPDQGVPDDVTCLIEFRQRVVSVKTNLDGPILVHCSAGIGRTGTYIALDSLTKEGESEGSVDIYACVRNLREQRVNMIQTAEQYAYLHKAVVHSLTFDSHAIGLYHFQQYMTKHESKTLAQMFQDLEHSVEKKSKDENEAIKRNSAMMEKNRKGADIPGDRNRPRLYLNLKPGASDYVNALNVNSFRHVNRFLLAQTPLPDTVDDFLTLVVQEKCSCIVNMEPETNKSKDVGIYYPADNQTLKREPFTVRTERVSSTQNFTHRRLTISNHGKAGSEDHIVQHFQLTSWVDGMKCPGDAAGFLDFLHHVELKSGGAEAGPVLVHCLTGAEKCGLFCVVSILLEKIQCDQEVSVVNTVRQVKSRRHRVIPNKEQYIFCHQCVNEYIRSFDNYSNVAARK